MLLHVSADPHSAVSGVFCTGKGGETNNMVLVMPFLSSTSSLIEQHYRLCKHWGEAGYYQGPMKYVKDNVPDFVALKVAEKIAENNNDACLIMIDNKKLCLNLQTAPIIVSQLTSDGKWKSKDKPSIHIEAGALDVISQLLQRKVQHDAKSISTTTWMI
ncbi:ER membrane protein complex subunit 8/9 homolog [Penaeus japonicus]|uniref:ER membrane protein complex subunit 8/9 homolog n=1 Tax=Penaeus japonicus TaxID=27405 RepID=UPI001C712A81|nr:ER membrane protein complex subunit 8/9 homolog [Penaeus japonicus]XP_042885843.1 ER membrane protein complex subunit 8/9 homolog [Penaeus japonicus]